MRSKKTSVAILYNHVGEDEFEKLREIDPSSLDFKPEYDIHVSTVREEYETVAKALRKEGFEPRIVNVAEKLSVLTRMLESHPPKSFSILSNSSTMTQSLSLSSPGCLTSTGFHTPEHRRSPLRSASGKG